MFLALVLVRLIEIFAPVTVVLAVVAWAVTAQSRAMEQ